VLLVSERKGSGRQDALPPTFFCEDKTAVSVFAGYLRCATRLQSRQALLHFLRRGPLLEQPALR